MYRLIIAVSLNCLLVVFCTATEPVQTRGSGTEESLRNAIKDLIATYDDKYPQGNEYLTRLETWNRSKDKIPTQLEELRSQAILAHPMLKEMQGLAVVESEKATFEAAYEGGKNMGQSLSVLQPVNPTGELQSLFKAKSVGFPDVHPEGNKILCSSEGQIYEIEISGRKVRKMEFKYGGYNPIYLPNGRICFISNALGQGVPCLSGVAPIGNLFSMNADGTDPRILTFDQDHNWDPVVMADGKILYVRWEYTDTPHNHTRLIFTMNPDGTKQTALCKSNLYWPNSIFWPRPLPDGSGRFVGIVTGHHSPRSGALYIFDPTGWEREGQGVVQSIPRNNNHLDPKWLAQTSLDGFNANPAFAHPYPLDSRFFLVASNYRGRWSIFVADVFDNLVLLKDSSQDLVHPVPIRSRSSSLIIPDITDRNRKDADVFLLDVYAGKGLSGVPHGTVKKLRLFEWHFGYYRAGGSDKAGGPNGIWEPHRILGTVPVEADGSAFFTVPALTPIAVQPLDADGKAVQIMRSWFTAQPGERLSCVGCHERTSEAPPIGKTTPLALQHRANQIEPWYGPARGFGFQREVQPVLNKYCIGCHKGGGQTATGRPIPNLTAKPTIVPNPEILKQMEEEWGTIRKPSYSGFFKGWKGYDASFMVLSRYIYRPESENDYVMPYPTEYDPDVSYLIQLLRSGHGGGHLDPQSWERLYTWIDLNAPMFGRWQDVFTKNPLPNHQQRISVRKMYGGIEDDPEFMPTEAVDLGVATIPPSTAVASMPKCLNWPFTVEKARKRQIDHSAGIRKTVKIENLEINMVWIPSGEFVMGSAIGRPNERPANCVKIPRGYWMLENEVSNELFALFDKIHDSRYFSMGGMNMQTRGIAMNQPRQPVTRVSWESAMSFAKWFSTETGLKFNLPTEAQWEWACRAGSEQAFWYGDFSVDFAPYENLADASMRRCTDDVQKIAARHLGDARFDDGSIVPVPMNSIVKDLSSAQRRQIVTEGYKMSSTKSLPPFKPNPWGLYHMHGNVAEWTISQDRPYPYTNDDGRNDPSGDTRRIVRGGSFADVPEACQASTRISYRPWQRVYNVGFRLICEAEP